MLLSAGAARRHAFVGSSPAHRDASRSLRIVICDDAELPGKISDQHPAFPMQDVENRPATLLVQHSILMWTCSYFRDLRTLLPYRLYQQVAGERHLQ